MNITLASNLQDKDYPIIRVLVSVLREDYAAGLVSRFISRPVAVSKSDFPSGNGVSRAFLRALQNPVQSDRCSILRGIKYKIRREEEIRIARLGEGVFRTVSLKSTFYLFDLHNTFSADERARRSDRGQVAYSIHIFVIVTVIPNDNLKNFIPESGKCGLQWRYFVKGGYENRIAGSTTIDRF